MSTIGPLAIALLLGVGCSRAPIPHRVQPAASATTVTTPAAVAPPAPARCEVTEGPDTIDDGNGRGSEYGREALENVRVLADASTSIVTWERQTEHTVGDSWRSPVLAIRRAGEKHRIVALPVMAYACATYGYAARPMSQGVWLRSLDSKSPFAVQLAKAGRDDKPADALAIVLGDGGGAAAYRFGGALHIVWLDASGRPRGAPARFDDGDVGAPALALAGSDVIIVWAKREAKTDPYRLRLVRATPEKPLSPPQVLPTTANAFAPAILATETALVLAWMEGDASRTGEIHVARTSVAEPSLVGSLVVSTGEANARDPELSGSVDTPVLVYSMFSKELAGGVVRIARLGCSAGR
jgi:hypothetical protein